MVQPLVCFVWFRLALAREGDACLGFEQEEPPATVKYIEFGFQNSTLRVEQYCNKGQQREVGRPV